MVKVLQKSDDLAKLILRIAISVIILFHGIAKLYHGIGWISDILSRLGIPGFIAYGTYAAELIAPIMIIIGFRSRIAALTITFDMIFAIVLVLRSQIFTIKEAGGGWSIELEMLLLLGSLTIFFLGAGKYKVINKENLWD